jgi:hypothetical protein
VPGAGVASIANATWTGFLGYELFSIGFLGRCHALKAEPMEIEKCEIKFC